MEREKDFLVSTTTYCTYKPRNFLYQVSKEEEEKTAYKKEKKMSDLNPSNMNMPGCSSTNPMEPSKILIPISPPPLMAIGKRHALNI